MQAQHATGRRPVPEQRPDATALERPEASPELWRDRQETGRRQIDR
jgi:hypothetical protein